MALADEAAAPAGVTAAIEGIVDTLAASRIKSAIAILIVALACFLPGFNTLPPIDRDEARIATATKLMLESGDYVDLRVGKATVFNSPIGVNWLQAAALLLLGKGADPPIWVFRLPALIGAIAAAYLTWWMALAFGRPRAALVAAWLFTASILVTAEAHIGRTNAVMLPFIVLSLGALARIWLAEDKAGPGFLLPFLFWTGFGLAILFGGIFSPLLVVLTVAVLVVRKRSLAWLGRLAPFPGAVWALVLVAPWLIAMALSLWHPALDPAVASLAKIETDTDFIAPPGSYVLAAWVALWPGAAFAALAIPWILDNARRRSAVFLLAAAVPYWIFLELYPVKLAHLFLPVLPALAILAALAVDEGRLPARGTVRWVVALGPVLWPILISATIVISIGSDGNPVALWPVPAFLASIVAGGLASYWLLREKSAVASAAVCVVSSIFLGLGIAGLVLPNLDLYRVAERVVAAGRAALDCPNPRFATVGFAEPSLAFFGGSRILVTNGERAADFLAAGSCRAAFVERRRQSVFTQRAADIGLETEVRGDVHGLNVGAIRRMRILIVVPKGSGK